MNDGNQHGNESGRSRLVRATDVAREAALQRAANGVRYAAFGENEMAPADIARVVASVPTEIAAALEKKAYYFVPLAMRAGEAEFDRGHRNPEQAMIAPVYTQEWSEEAICHRNVGLGGIDGVFISTRLLNDRFALAFEFFINVGHAFVEIAGVPEGFSKLVWGQVTQDVRGETSQDAWESRGQSMVRARIGGADAVPKLHVDEKARLDYLEATFADAVAIYLLSLSIDFNYSELREREYPLLAPQALAERLRLVAQLFPPNDGYEFAIRYRRRA
jgi:hypothetical protein